MNATPIPGGNAGDPFAAIDTDLELLNTLPLAEQVPVFGRIHSALTAALAATAASGETAPPVSGGGR